MHKRILAIVTLLCAVPLIASAWTLNTWVRSQGGNVKVGNYAANTVLTGSTFKSYTSTNGYNAVVTADANYFINNLIIDGVPTTPTTSSTTTIAVPSGASSIWVDFLRNQLSFVVSGGTGYIVAPSGSQPNVYAGSTYRVFSFIPAKGQNIASIVATNLTFSTVPATLPASPNQKVIVTVSKITANATLSATVGGTAAALTPGKNTDGTTMTLAQAARACDACHIAQGIDTGGLTILKPYSSGAHKSNPYDVVMCATCHTGASTGAHPGQLSCVPCHSVSNTPHDLSVITPDLCANCHTSDNNPHNVTYPPQTPTSGNNSTASCLGCHSLPQTNSSYGYKVIAGLVDDNNGVRAISAEFGKWSHHVTGVTLQDAHCAACHLEGKALNGKIVVDATYHMTADATTHLRNCSTDADLKWTPDAPDFATMDTFCMSCHNANGATSSGSQAVRALMVPATGKVASATNPFGDTISNQYDKMQRPAVVDAAGQFATTNPSHHAVLGARYSGRTRVAGSRSIDSVAFTANSSATLPGPRTTIYDAGKFNATYRTLSAAPSTTDKTLGDDSILHCADCHTVGQFAARGSVAFKNMSNAYVGGGITNFYKTAIGAHGSNNEYMLRNSIGSDARHQGIQLDASGVFHADAVTPYLVCYNCHAIANYGLAAHAGDIATHGNGSDGACNVSVNTNSVNLTGQNRLDGIFTMTSGTDTFGLATGTTAGNIFGIQCNNCHNSGISAGNIFGGIHGSKDATYTDGAGNTTKHERFLPGLGNVMYVPGTQGGIFGGHSSLPVKALFGPTGAAYTAAAPYTYTFKTGGITSDLNWEENQSVRVVQIKGSGAHVHQAGPAGCYTISDGTLDGKTVPAQDGSDDAEGTGIISSLVPASKGLKAPDGTLLFGNWGGCADHQQAPGTTPRSPRSGSTSIRPVTY